MQNVLMPKGGNTHYSIRTVRFRSNDIAKKVSQLLYLQLYAKYAVASVINYDGKK